MRHERLRQQNSGATSMSEATKPETHTAVTESANPLSEREHRSLVIEYNHSAASYPADKTIVELFEAQVARTPNSEAIRLGNQSLNFGRLNERANQLAAHLRCLGVGLEQPVIIYMEHSLEVVCAILGVLKAGAAYVPIDPASTPKQRLSFILRDILAGTAAHTGLPLIITHSRLVSNIPGDAAKVITLDSDFAQIEQYPASNPERAVAPTNLAYVIYTSGSTGGPKGVLIEHRSLVNYTCWASQMYCQGEPLAWPLFSSLAFDLTVTSIFTPLISGGRIVVYPEDQGVHGLAVLKAVEDRAVDIVKLTPSHLGMIKDIDLAATKIRKLIVGGEDFKTELARHVAGKFRRPVEIYNEYGPTEATVGCMIHRFDAEKDRGLSVPIGIPAANAGVYILDEHFNPVPTGVTGEMYLAGDGLARGYLNRPELTTQKFLAVKDPRQNGPAAESSLSEPPPLRLYKTGDIARWSADGRMEFLGRIDDQVKIGGMRIELGEIEARLRSLPGVSECIVDVSHSGGVNAAKELIYCTRCGMASNVPETSFDAEGVCNVCTEPPAEEPGIDRLVAYYVSAKPLTVTEVRAHLAKELPDYMVPPYVVWLQRMPLTPNGKLDRKALPVPTYEHMQPAEDFVRPRTETEKALAVIWTELLKVDNVGINDDFFDLGGHSLLAIRAVPRIRDVFGVDITFQILFENPTIAAMANVLNAMKSSGSSANSGKVQRIERRKQSGPAPLSFAQEQLWFMDHLAPGNAVYNVVDVVDFHGAYNAEGMRRTIKELMRRHETLRTAFSFDGGQPMQVIVPDLDLPLVELDLSPLPEAERQREWTRLVHEVGRKPFDLSQAPLLRAAMVHLSAHEHRLLLTIHHILTDEWSMEIFHQEIKRLYDAFSAGWPSPLPELPIQYSDFASWQRDWLKGDVLDGLTSYWKKELAGAPSILELPTDKPRPATQSFRGATETFQLPAKLLDELKTLGREQQSTLFMILEAAFMALLHRYTGQDDIVVGTPISGRTHGETQNLVGLFLNTVLLRAKFSRRESFLSLVQQVRARALGAYAHPDLPFERLVAELAPNRDSSRTPLFQVMFILHNSGVSQVSKVAGNHELETGTSKFDLTLVLSENEKGLDGLIEYSTDLFEQTTIRRLAGYFSRLLEASVANPEQSISELPMLPEAERHQLLVDWNDTATELPHKTLCLHQLIEAQAARTPDQVALVFEGQKLTYGELNRRANQLAQHLSALGVGPDVLVGVYVPRSIEMVVGILGILKAGGAYVPIDPSYPSARIALVIEDSHLGFILTTKQVRAALPSTSANIISLDGDAETISTLSPAAISSSVTEKNLAYVIYTSGSTGKPKGVMIEHRNVTNFFTGMDQILGIEPGIWLAVTSISFDISVLELLWTLARGFEVVIHAEGNSDKIPSEIVCHGVTHLQLTPSLLRALTSDALSLEVLGKLKTILVGGEALPASLVASLRQSFSGELLNMYGPTETAIWSTVYRLQEQRNSIPIGKPIANTQVYVLDSQLQLVPPGGIGNLFIGGDGVVRGYFNRPELTAERFINDPFRPGNRIYRTGDLARFLPDGNLEFVGRADFQVKIRGFRIELGEIETTLEQQPGVAQAVVVAREDRHADKILAAYFVAKNGQPVDTNSLRSAVEAALPNYMVPSRFVQLESLPLTANGKIDRNALPPISQPANGSTNGGEDPRGEFEQLLANAWAESLGLNRICRDDNFFSLGGHSLAALKIAFKTQQEFNVDFPLQMFVQFPVLREQAKRLEEMLVEQADASVLESLMAEVIQSGESSFAGQANSSNSIDRLADRG
jgi:amino acid adenylation domain-containing protein